MRVPDRLFNSPLHPDRVRRIIGLLDVDAESTILDVGCGAGAMLEMAVTAHGCRGVGVDPRAYEIDDARRRLSGDRIELHAATIQNVDLPCRRFDAAFCVGATHAYGRNTEALPATIEALRAVVRPGGELLIGEGYWRHDPDPAYLEMTCIERGSLTTHSENIERVDALGLDLLYATTSSAQEWDDFESLGWRAAENALRAFPDSAECRERAEHWRRWRRAYWRWGRETMGFGLYLWRLP